LGYYNNEELTSSKFVTNKLNPLYRETYYLTGDLVSKNRDGLISFHGRRDNQVKHLGYRIELSEIENAINLHEKIKNSVVTYSKDEKEIRLIYESENELTSKELVVHFKKYLPKYMIPTRFKQIPKMPMNPNGKIDRLKLTDVFLSDN
jgi:acyl-coenzyme A synthetase/AMP-(fatty) acid ligase